MDGSKEEKFNKIIRLKEGQRIALISTVLLFLLALLKALVGYRFHSPLLVADAYHSGADILINCTSLIGLWLASRKKTARFPYGLYRAETMACLLIGMCIIYIGFNISMDGVQKLYQLGPAGEFPVFPIGAAMISCVTSLVLAVKQKAVGKAIGSRALLATAREAFFDIFTSLVVLAGILLVFLRTPYVEGAVMIMIAVLIIKLGLETVWISLMILMDANLDIDLQTEIEEKINRIYGVKGVSGVKIRQSGPFKMIECIIKTNRLLPLYKAHEMADQVESLLYTDYPSIESAFIHVEPDSERSIVAIMPVLNINGLHSRIHEHFGRAPYFIIIHINDRQIDIEDFYLNEFLDHKGHIGLNVVKSIIRYKINLLFTSRIGEISFHILKNNFVDIYKADAGTTVAEVINLYHSKQLSTITMPTHSIEKSQVARSDSVSGFTEKSMEKPGGMPVVRGDLIRQSQDGMENQKVKK